MGKTNHSLSHILVSMAAHTKYHSLQSSSNRHLFLIVLGTWKSKIKVPARSGSWWELPSLQVTLFSKLVSSFTSSSVHTCKDWEREQSLFLFFPQATKHIRQPPRSWPNLNLITSPSPNTICCTVRASTYGFEGEWHKHSVHNKSIIRSSAKNFWRDQEKGYKVCD